jgi:ribosomal subunit interface protein
MKPFQITFLDFPESDAVWLAVQKRIERLEHFFKRIIRCEVVLSCPHRHRHADRLFHVQIRIFIPGEDIIVKRNHPKDEAHRDIYVAIRDAFDAAERILKDQVRKARHEVKSRKNNYEEGRVSKIFYEDGYGFIISKDGREFYFAENSVTNGDFNHLKIGQKVHFLDELGEKGPQVTSMSVV